MRDLRGKFKEVDRIKSYQMIRAILRLIKVIANYK